MRRRAVRRLLGAGCGLVLGVWPLLSIAQPAPACDEVLDFRAVSRCAVLHNPDLELVEKELDVLFGQRQRAATLLPTHPTVQISAAGRRPATAMGQSAASGFTANWYLTLSQELEIAGQRGARLVVADQEISAQRQRGRQSAQEIAASALGAYYQLLAAQEELELSQKVAGFAEQLSAVAVARADNALLSPVDADVAQAEAARLASLRDESERNLTDAQIRLSALLGLKTPPRLHVSGTLEELPGTPISQSDNLEEAVTQALSRRGEVAAAQIEQSVQAARIRLLRRERIPNPTLSIFAQRDGFDEQVFGAALAMPLPLPAPLGPSRAGEIAAATAEAEKSRSEILRLHRQVRAEVLRAVLHERSYEDQVRHYPRPLIDRARADLFALAQALLEKKLAPKDVLLSQRSLLEFLFGQVLARRGLALSRIERLRATGEPLFYAGGTP